MYIMKPLVLLYKTGAVTLSKASKKGTLIQNSIYNISNKQKLAGWKEMQKCK